MFIGPLCMYRITYLVQAPSYKETTEKTNHFILFFLGATLV